MKLKSFFTTTIVFSGLYFLTACGEGVDKSAKPIDVQELTKNQPETHGAEIKESDIQLTNPLNAEWISSGKNIYELKCQSCHRLTEEKLVGPGWKDVTKRRKPVWIMNMATNVDMMLETDAEAQKLLEQCMVRMPNQNLAKEDARKVLEFMRSNDGEK
jgi:cytochrome c551/c552